MKFLLFKSQSDLRIWFSENHDSTEEIWIAFYKKNSGKVSASYLEAVDEAFCFGWIDGIRKRIDDLKFANRFTPRRPKSNWSKINIDNVKRLKKAGKMTPSGREEFKRAKADGRIKVDSSS